MYFNENNILKNVSREDRSRALHYGTTSAVCALLESLAGRNENAQRQSSSEQRSDQQTSSLAESLSTRKADKEQLRSSGKEKNQPLSSSSGPKRNDDALPLSLGAHGNEKESPSAQLESLLRSICASGTTDGVEEQPAEGNQNDDGDHSNLHENELVSII